MENTLYFLVSIKLVVGYKLRCLEWYARLVCIPALYSSVSSVRDPKIFEKIIQLENTVGASGDLEQRFKRHSYSILLREGISIYPGSPAALSVMVLEATFEIPVCCAERILDSLSLIQL